MAKNNEAKVKFTADTTEFTSQIKNANSAMSALRAGMQLNDAQFRNTGNSADYLKQKQQLLTAQIQQSQSKQEALNQKLQAAKNIYGENSSEAQQWATKLTRAQTEEEKLQSALDETNSAIEAQAAAEQKAATPLEQLNTKIQKQENELKDLQTQYANVALAEGKDSSAAQELKGKIDSLNNELSENKSRLNEVTGAAQETGAAVQNTGGNFTFLKGVLVNIASNAITTGINKLKEFSKETIKLGMDFTASMSNVQALSGATAEEMANLEARAKELGRSTVFSAKDVSDAFGYMALAGWDSSQMLSGVDGVLNLAAASQMDLAKASDIVTDYLTAFGLSASDSGKFVDQMAYAMSHSNTNTEQLGEAYKNVASTAHSMGYSVEDTTAALMTMANAGVKGGEAGTGLSSIMTRLATNTKDCADQLSEYGVEVYDSQGNMNSLSSILNGCAGIWGELSDQQQANLAKTIAGTNQYSKFQTVMTGLSQQAQESGQSFNDYTEALENCEGAAAEMSATMQDNLSGDMKALGSAAQGLGLQLFEYFEGPLRSGAQLATSALNAVTDAITPQRSELQSFIEETASAVESSRGILENAKNLASSASERVGELEAYKNVLLDLNGQAELDEYQQYQLKNAIDALGDSVPGLAAAFDETTGTLNLTNKELVEMFNNAEALAMQQALIDAQTESYNALAEATIAKARADASAKKASEDLADANQRNQKSIEETGSMYGEYYTEVLNAEEAVKSSKEQQEEAQKVMDDARESIETDRDALAGLAEEYGLSKEQLEGLKSAQEEATETAGDAADATGEFADATGELSAEAREASEEVIKAYEEMRENIREAMQSSVSFMDEFSGGTEITADEIDANLQSQIEGIANWSENIQRLAGEAGEGMRRDMYDALVQMGPESANLVQTLVDTLDSDTGKFQSICDHWAEAMNLSNNADAMAAATSAGKAYAGETAGGIESGTGDVAGAVQSMADQAAQNADMTAAAQKTSKGFTDNVSKGMTQATSSISKETGNMKSAAQSGLNGMNAAAAVAMGKMKQTVQSAMNSAKQSVQSGVSAMRSALSVSLQGPHIRVPHFSMSGSFNAQTGSVPHVSVSWYRQGAIFTQPTIFATPYGFKGVGEAGPEAVLPIDQLRDYIGDALNDSGSGNTFNIPMTVNGAEDPSAWAAEFARDLKQRMRIG